MLLALKHVPSCLFCFRNLIKTFLIKNLLLLTWLKDGIAIISPLLPSILEAFEKLAKVIRTKKTIEHVLFFLCNIGG